MVFIRNSYNLTFCWRMASASLCSLNLINVRFSKIMSSERKNGFAAYFFFRNRTREMGPVAVCAWNNTRIEKKRAPRTGCRFSNWAVSFIENDAAWIRSGHCSLHTCGDKVQMGIANIWYARTDASISTARAMVRGILREPELEGPLMVRYYAHEKVPVRQTQSFNNYKIRVIRQRHLAWKRRNVLSSERSHSLRFVCWCTVMTGAFNLGFLNVFSSRSYDRWRGPRDEHE